MFGGLLVTLSYICSLLISLAIDLLLILIVDGVLKNIIEIKSVYTYAQKNASKQVSDLYIAIEL